jgi:hypothetical protein
MFSFILISSGVLAAAPQSSDTTAQARQHYQNGVAAIAKNDWQRAKNEFLQVTNLAPENAVAHYNLALAYSHTGSLKSAQAELSKALQLGLPAEQKQAASELKQKLAAQSAAGSTATSDRGAKQENNVADILEWLKDKLESDGGASFFYNDAVKKSSYILQISEHIEHIDGCRFTLLRHFGSSNEMYDGKPSTPTVPTDNATVIDLSKLRADVHPKHVTLPDTYRPNTFWTVEFYVSDSNSPLSQSAVESSGTTSTKSVTMSDVSFAESGQDIAVRVSKAINDAIEKCGGRRVKELY